MNYRRSIWGLSVLLIAPLFAAAEPDKPAPPPGTDKPAPPPGKVEAERYESIQKTLGKISADLSDLRSRMDSAEVVLPQSVDNLKERVARLEKALDRLNATTRRSSYFTPEGAAPSGVIRLQNRSAVEATVDLNGQAYVLAPMETVVLASQPVGAFTYEVRAGNFGVIKQAVTRSLTAGETFSITIGP